MGSLISSIHRSWARSQGTYMGVGNDLRYTPSTCFETFPFPHPTDEQRLEIEKWVKYIVKLREHLLAQEANATLTGIYNQLEALRKAPDAADPVTSPGDGARPPGCRCGSRLRLGMAAE